MDPRRLRLLVLVTGAIAAAIVLGAWTQPWFDVVLVDDTALSVTGQTAAPALSGIALATLALVGALTIARPRLRVVLGVVQFALGVLVVGLVASTVGSPIRAAAPAITDATGVSGSDSVAALVASAGVSAWPWIALLGGVLTAVAGAAVVITGRRWPAPTNKYDADAAKADATAGAWDALSEGDDPTTR